MDSSMNVESTANVQGIEAHHVAAQIAKWWWVWLVFGVLWIFASLVILQFHITSVTLVGIIIGIMFLVAGAQEFFIAAITESWRWLWIAFGVFLIIAGIIALVNPIGTFVAIAEILGFLTLLVGAFWVIEAFLTKEVNELWWLGLIAGIMMIVMGFWVGGQYFITKAATLLIFVGIWALFHGITDIFRAFHIKKMGEMVAG
jgi:uncharacterized membrane protein HdeD (DUF308 family)